MPRRLLRLMSEARDKPSRHVLLEFEINDVVWALGSFCALNQKPFDAELLVKQFPPPYTGDAFIHAARGLEFRIKRQECRAETLSTLHLPCLAVLSPLIDEKTSQLPSALSDSLDTSEGSAVFSRPALVVKATAHEITYFAAGTNVPVLMSLSEFALQFAGMVYQLTPREKAANDPDGKKVKAREFGFAWFIPELLKYKKVWRDVLVASLIIQLLALGTPLFTQVVIDKVVVHRTESTLVVIAIGLAVFMLFSALLSWVRQYLVLHTGNRVDAVLGSEVFNHLFKLPTRYFEHRPTGVIAARLHGVESIREFVSSAAVTLMLDLPFLLIFVAIMFYYSVLLTLVALALILVIVVLSLVMAPVFRTRLNKQFLLGARNQAFITEYVSGLETVKSLQMEPQLSSKYGGYLAEYLKAGFDMKQIANSYNVAANGIEQFMSLAILVAGAYTVMHDPEFTIGMLIAFQMFAGRVSQPMLRIVGLWQQFQQANMSVQRLGDIMNAPTEPYSILPSRIVAKAGHIKISNLSFRYGENLPFLYQDLNIEVEPGKIVAVMGASGTGKSTLTKLLQGFYLASSGEIKIDNNDIRHLSANELRSYFGVVPQETILFSGTIYENLLMANPHATFEGIVHACRLAEIHEMIESLPNGYQSEIGERGAGLSGGQKQRLAIARALLKNPKILIFDEATSSLDAETAAHFSSTINRLKGAVTILFITHALPTNLEVDKLIKLAIENKK